VKTPSNFVDGHVPTMAYHLLHEELLWQVPPVEDYKAWAFSDHAAI